MKQLRRVFWHEYWEHVTRRGYLIFTFGFPIFIVLIPSFIGGVAALALYLALPPTDPRPIGIVDQVPLLITSTQQATIQAQGALAMNYNTMPIIFFRSTTEAAAALNTDYIQAYYHLPPDYWDKGEATLTYHKAPNELTRALFTNWVRSSVRQGVSDEILSRFTLGANITHKDLAGQSRDFSMVSLIEGAIVYMIIYFVRLVGTSFTANYMFDSIANEADDRTIEILITSVSPLQFLLGKLFGLLAVGLTQLAMWGSLGVILLQGVSLIININLLSYILHWPYFWVLISMILGAYLMDHILAAALGLLKVSGGAGMQFFALINLVSGFGLLYATYFVPRNPHTPIAIFTSLFPLTSPIVLLIRLVVSEVPMWQILIAQLLLWLTNIVAIYWLLRLLKNNLVAYKPPFKLWPWLQDRLPPSPYARWQQWQQLRRERKNLNL